MNQPKHTPTASFAPGWNCGYVDIDCPDPTTPLNWYSYDAQLSMLDVLISEYYEFACHDMAF